MNTQAYIDQGYIDFNDGVEFQYNHEAANCFGCNYTSTVMRGSVAHPYEDDVLLWFPKTDDKQWNNSAVARSGDYFEEKCLNQNPEEVKKRLDKVRNDERKKRIIFFAKERNGTVSYKFLGLYKLVYVDYDDNTTLWKRIATRVKTYPSKQD